MNKIIEMNMLDESWNVGTKYGTFELSYLHTTMLEDRYIEVLQFDITHIDISTGSNPGGKALDQPGQKLVQMRLSREIFEDGLKIKTIELVDREDAVKDTKFKRPCGRESPIRTVFRSTEWDYYGHIGMWERTFHLIPWTVGEWLYNHIPLFILTGICLAGYFLILRRAHRQQQAAGRGEEDVEAALLEETEEKDLLESGEKLDQENAEEEADTPFPSAANAALLD